MKGYEARWIDVPVGALICDRDHAPERAGAWGAPSMVMLDHWYRIIDDRPTLVRLEAIVFVLDES